MTVDKYLEILQKYWGYADFRGIQRDIIESVGCGKDTLGLMPTGGGKSVTFQVPAMAMDGLCLVITPLIALMKDQVQNLRKKGIRAAAINLSMSHDDVVSTLETCIFGGYKFLYVSPERLASSLFLTKLSRIHVCLIAIDEAHCISQWGYDFRPSYLNLGTLREMLPDVPVLALTASATPTVAEDIQTQLRFKEPNVFRMSFDRKNLVYVVRHVSSVENELLHILRSTTGSSIVYCRSRDGVAEIAKLLIKNDISSTFYHAGLAAELRDCRQKEWTDGRVRVMVATNAFGMGIDKADVRVVIHAGVPDSLEAYYQEAGRAGRDGQTSYAVLLYDNAHITRLRRRVQAAFPPRETIAAIYEHICCFLQLAVNDGQDVRREFNMDKFCVTFRHYPATVSGALHILEQSGYISFEEDPQRASRLQFLLRRDELYRLNEFKGKGEAILNSVLRNYGGVFCDEKFISEQYLAETCGSTAQEVYDFLKTLAQRRIVRYIPVRQCTIITFTRRRVDTDRLFIPKEVYEDRRDAFQKRIDAVIAYAQTADCRGNIILEYFGETKDEACCHCDNCTSRHISRAKEDMMPTVKKAIVALCKENKSLNINRLHELSYPLDLVSAAAQQLVDDGALRMDGCMLICCGS